MTSWLYSVWRSTMRYLFHLLILSVSGRSRDTLPALLSNQTITYAHPQTLYVATPSEARYPGPSASSTSFDIFCPCFRHPPSLGLSTPCLLPCPHLPPSHTAPCLQWKPRRHSLFGLTWVCLPSFVYLTCHIIFCPVTTDVLLNTSILFY